MIKMLNKFAACLQADKPNLSVQRLIQPDTGETNCRKILTLTMMSLVAVEILYCKISLKSFFISPPVCFCFYCES